MFISKALGISRDGNLTVGGADTVLLAEHFGTPLYVMDENLIVENIKAYKDSIEQSYDGHGMVLYASKAFMCKEMARIAEREGIGLDIVSGGELYTADSVGFPLERACLHGNNKDMSEIETALERGVGRIVADSAEELSIINSLALSMKKHPKVLLRIKPGVEAHTHEFIQTGQNDSKFGVSLEGGEAFDVFDRARKYDGIDLCGIHCHIGSQIFDEEPFIFAARLLIKFMAKLKNELGIKITELNLGGGFGIKYLSSDKPKPYRIYMDDLLSGVKRACDDFGVERPFIMVEPGRSIVGAAGATIYEVGAVKDIPGVRKYVSVNGGMSDNPRYILYGAEYEALLCRAPYAEKLEKVTIVGKHCESGDILIKDAKMPHLIRGDIIAVLQTGAYNYSMASNYNRVTRPAAVMVRDGVPRLIITRESFEDLVRNDI